VIVQVGQQPTWMGANPDIPKSLRELPGSALRAAPGMTRQPVNNGNSGDIYRGVVAPRVRPWLYESSYGDGKPPRRFGLQFATDPISSGFRSGCGREIGPRAPTF